MSNMANAVKREIGDLIDHWLLNLAVHYPIRLGRLFSFLTACTKALPTVEAEAFNAKPVPHCSSEEYANALIRLFDSGMIELAFEVTEHDIHVEDVPVFEFPEVPEEDLHSKA